MVSSGDEECPSLDPLLSRGCRARLAGDTLAGRSSSLSVRRSSAHHTLLSPGHVCPGNNRQQPDADRVNGVF